MLALLLEKEVEFSLFNSDSEFQILYAIEIIYIITTAIELSCFCALLKENILTLKIWNKF